MKKYSFISKLIITSISGFLLISIAALGENNPNRFVSLSRESKSCIDCHKVENPNIYQQWGASGHYQAKVGCYECHESSREEPDAFKHEGKWIATIVSPKDCAKCHPNEVSEFLNSNHSRGGLILHGSVNNLLAEVIEGNRGLKTEAFPDGISAAAVNGCWQCHGSEVKVSKGLDKKGNTTVILDQATWPNTGISRGNPDGSLGSCSACHSRHQFSAAQARQPENCGKCHMGPGHPQAEIYAESKHGISYTANLDIMNLKSPKWVLGEDYFAAPTCATCHMSATTEMPLTHNVGLRIKWNNRPPISQLANQTDKKRGLTSSAKISAEQRRQNMKNICIKCHNINYTDSFFVRYEAMIDLYSDKFARPGLKLYDAASKVLKALNGKKYARFAQMIDYTWFELWHHEGRRARQAASMQGPTYAHWHGTYVLAKHWYGKFLPEIRQLIHEGKRSQIPTAKKAAAELEVLLMQTMESKDHKWALGKEDQKDKNERTLRRKKFLNRYR